MLYHPVAESELPDFVYCGDSINSLVTGHEGPKIDEMSHMSQIPSQSDESNSSKRSQHFRRRDEIKISSRRSHVTWGDELNETQQARLVYTLSRATRGRASVNSCNANSMIIMLSNEIRAMINEDVDSEDFEIFILYYYGLTAAFKVFKVGSAEVSEMFANSPRDPPGWLRATGVRLQ
ncbi:hypothetical protein BDZ89DRAFT_1033410 [Hymenopellis radicata]|nr:hypothetical protein BDZ89DRAFT_1033410 [Hymenopellis radicata]